LALSAAPLPSLAVPSLRGSIGIHDPSTIIKCKDRYYIFGTGQGIISKSSSDKIFWTRGPKVFAAAPSWTTNLVPGFTGTFWAPDVLYLNGRYCLYYSVSTWGSQVSAIGLATNPTLDPADSAYRWTDQGPVIQSGVGSAYNTIDPSVMLDANGDVWMSFGSYWNGIYLVQLNSLTGGRIAPSSPTYRLAANSLIEASCLCQRGTYYYLFVNWGSCCSGVNSTYNVRVGRSTNVFGPYLDRNGVNLVNAGGTLFLEGTGKFTGPGHVGILSEGNQQWFSYHYYDAGAYAPWYHAYGVADFDLEPLSWTSDNWPAFTNDWSAVYHFRTDARDENGQYYGFLQNGASIRADPVHGAVLDLNGTNQYVQLPAGVAYARTFAAVVKWNGGPPWQRIFDFGTDTSSYVMLTPASAGATLRCDIRVGGTTQTVQAPAGLPVGIWTHVAVTLDGQKGILYVNGQPVVTNTVTLSPLDVRAQTNHLGHSKFTADPDFSGEFASFRAYGCALSAAEICAPLPNISEPQNGAQYSPGETLRFLGNATDFADVPLPADSLRWRIEYCGQNVTNLVLGPLAGVTNGTYSVPATGPAATNGYYHISLEGIDAAGRRTSRSVDVFPLGTGSNHWASFYPFDAGGQDASNQFPAVLLNGASIQADTCRGNVLNLNGSGPFASFPAGVGGLQSFGAWVKWNGGAAWQRVFDFGQDTTRYLFLTPADSNGHLQCALTTDAADFVQVLEAPTALPVGAWTHLGVVFDGRQGILYENGEPVAINNSVNLLPSDIAATRTWLGRSQFPADPYFNGRLDEVALNSQPLTWLELMPPVSLACMPAGGSVVLAWPAWAWGLNLYSATNVSSSFWSPVAPVPTLSDRMWMLTLAMTNGGQVFRLQSP
jgi:hypothetical protein